MSQIRVVTLFTHSEHLMASVYTCIIDIYVEILTASVSRMRVVTLYVGKHMSLSLTRTGLSMCGALGTIRRGAPRYPQSVSARRARIFLRIYARMEI